MFQGKNVLIGVSGGIAAYKACTLVSRFVQNGADVRVMMTESAQKFVQPLTFQALSRNPVYTDTFDEFNPEKIAHIDIADWADFVVLAPATANIMAKLATGLADDMFTTTMLATTAPVYIAPAMNVHMYSHPAVMQNMNTLSSRGYHFIEPNAGYLACGYIGKGRLEEPEEIMNVIKRHQEEKSILQGKKVLISAGPTRETIDPVRFFSNRSSGKMGFALAEMAAELGADVTLVTGPVHLATRNNRIHRVDVVTAEEMYEAMHKYFNDVDIVIKAAAVADYRPKVTHREKMKKQPGNLVIEFERTKDILKSLGEQKQKQFLIGFAAETNDPLNYGKEKLIKKNLDAIVINNVSEQGAGFAGDTNIVTYINKNHTEIHFPLAQKEEIARQILLQAFQDMQGETN